jgi:gliding motility-associated-like protein
MTIVAALVVEGDTSTDTRDKIGAFVGTECRGVTSLQYVPALDKYLTFITVYSNVTSGETVIFKIYDASADLVFTAPNNISFSQNGQIGTDNQPYSIITNNPPVNLTLSNSEIFENEPSGTLIGILSAVDPDLGNTLTFSLPTGQADNAFFTIDGNQLKSSQVLDFETKNQYMILAEVSDNHYGFVTKAFPVFIKNKNESPVIPATFLFNVTDDLPSGSLIGSVLATDPDVGQTLSYAITSAAPTGFVSIGANGMLTVSAGKTLNYEQDSIYHLTVTISDNGSPIQTVSSYVTIQVTDVDYPITNITLSDNSLNENLPAGSIIATLGATDQEPEAFTFMLPAGMQDNRYFTIQGDKLRADASFDFETKNVYSVLIQASDRHNSLQKQFFINIGDVNEYPVTSYQKFSISEDIPVGSFVGYVDAFDSDKGQILTYSIVEGNSNTAFKIDKNTGELTVNNAGEIDYETHQAFVLKIRIADNFTPSLSSFVYDTVRIMDVNYLPASMELSDNHIVENSAIGTAIGMLSATDPEPTETFTYTLPNPADTSYFRIVQNTLVAKIPFNYEIRSSYPVMVRVTDRGGKSLTKTFQILITDVNEKPVINDQLFDVLEGTVNGTLVGNITATDSDNAQALLYKIISGNTSNAFAVKTNTGELIVNNQPALVYETHPVFHLSVVVSDNQNPALYDTAIITVEIVNLPSSIQTFRLSGSQITENSSIGTVIGNIQSAGSEPTDIFTISMLPVLDFDKFNIINDSVLISNDVFDFEDKPFYSIKLNVRNNTGVQLTKTFQIAVINVNEKPVIADQEFSITEDQPMGTTTDYVTASDVDYGQNLSYVIIGGNLNNAFTLNRSSGELTVNNGAALNYEVKPNFNLQVKVYDDALSPLSDTANIIVNILDYNYPPTNIDLSNNKIDENMAPGTFIGTFSATDIEPTETFSFSIPLPSDTLLFAIKNNAELVSKAPFNFENKQTYPLFIKVKDSGGLTFSKLFNLQVTDINEKPVLNDQHFEMVEEKSQNSVIGYVVASDPDNGQSLTYEIISGNIDDAFTVQAGSGALLVNNPSVVDYEVNPQFNLVMKVTDNGVPAKSDTGLITVNLSDFNYKPTDIILSYNKVEENGTARTLIGILKGVDPEPTETFSFLLNNLRSDDSYFEIKGDTLYSKFDFDFEQKNEYTISVTTKDSKGATFQKDLLISVIDKNDHPVVNDAVFEIAEDSPENTNIGYIDATDADKGQQLSYSILTSAESGAFKIDKATGLLSVGKPVYFDYEINHSFQIGILVKDNGTPVLSDTARIVINILDVNYPPNNIELSKNTILENQPQGTFIGTLTGFDRESQESFTFSLKQGVGKNDLFFIRNDSIFSSKILDYEEMHTMDIFITVQDSKDAQFSKYFSMYVLNVNEKPIINDQSFQIDENKEKGKLVGNVLATDPDFDQKLFYRIRSGNGSGVFTIDSISGAVSVNNNYLLDYETHKQFDIYIEVYDNGMPPLNDSAKITINVNNSPEVQLSADNFFTPNDDGYNDYWKVDSPGQVADYELIIFDVSGKIVFRTTSYKNNWDGTYKGTKLPEGTYYYLFTSPTGNKIYKGFITIKL